ncbi:unnamed protein product [Hydatigera taeniaeformis]|uniref:Uncharacterized protein n=1 Tax=Hydatigena taeniaeformis TaxID=6205 RepID=A0A0R3X7S5_HYDTA|nr:unnamed protein product [Hydatigera taeniaeformis]
MSARGGEKWRNGWVILTNYFHGTNVFHSAWMISLLSPGCISPPPPPLQVLCSLSPHPFQPLPSPSASHIALVRTSSFFHSPCPSSTFSPSCASTSISTFDHCYLLIFPTGQSSLLQHIPCSQHFHPFPRPHWRNHAVCNGEVRESI